MKQLIATLLLSGLVIFSGCDKKSDDYLGQGAIRIDEKSYPLTRATLVTEESTPALIDGTILHSFLHTFRFRSGGNLVEIAVSSDNVQFEVGEYRVVSQRCDINGNSILARFFCRKKPVESDTDQLDWALPIRFVGSPDGVVMIDFESKKEAFPPRLFFEWKGKIRKN